MRTREEVLKDIKAISRKLHEAKLLFRKRVDLYVEGRSLTPPITQREMAEASGLTEIAVTKALHKRRQEPGVDADPVAAEA